MSHIDSYQAMLRQVPLATTAAAWQALPYQSPLRRHTAMPPPPLAGWLGAIKRATDIAVALLTLAVHIPLLLAVAIAIKLDSPGPVLFLQRRVGVHGRPFALLKFRTMQHQPAAAESRAAAVASRCGARIPPAANLPERSACHPHRRAAAPHLPRRAAAALERAARRDVACGTAPTRARHLCRRHAIRASQRRYALRHRVRPGMTGLAQVRGWRGQTDTEEKLLRRLDSDLEYIATWSLWQDWLILARTAATVCERNAY